MYYYAQIVNDKATVQIPMLMSRCSASTTSGDIIRTRAESTVLRLENKVNVFTKYMNFTKEQMYNSSSQMLTMINECNMEAKKYVFKLEITNNKNMVFPAGTSVRLLGKR